MRTSWNRGGRCGRQDGRHRSAAAVIAASLGFAAAGALSVPAAGAYPAYQVSGRPYTFPAICPSQGVDGEVSAAIDPHSGRMVAAWIQDAEGLDVPALTTSVDIVSTSPDGVRWTRSAAPPGAMLCDTQPGPNDFAVDPSVSVGPDGRWYLARMAGEANGTNLFGAATYCASCATVGMYVSTSKDGTHWSAVPVPIPDDQQDDFDTIVADPSTAGRAYVTLINYQPYALSVVVPERQNRILISSTTDGGGSFSLPITVHQSPRGYLDLGSRLAALSDGSLLETFWETPANVAINNSGPFTLYSTRSVDHGQTWSALVKVATGAFAPIVDPRTRTPYEPFCCVFSLSSGRDNTAAVAWTTTAGTSGGDVHIVTSRDGGKSWSAPTDLHRAGPAFEATVATTGRELAVTWYDFTQPAAHQARPTTFWVARSSDGGATWSTNIVGGPFDLSTATALGPGSYLGDYQSLLPRAGGGFEAVYTLAKPQARNGGTDIFASPIP